jgi:hypothetical protein
VLATASRSEADLVVGVPVRHPPAGLELRGKTGRADAEEFAEYLDGPEGGTAFPLRVEYRWELGA